MFRGALYFFKWFPGKSAFQPLTPYRLRYEHFTRFLPVILRLNR